VTDAADVQVSCESAPDGWRCEVIVRDGGGETRHDVTVSAADAEDLGAAHDPRHVQRVVEEAFDFLLEREPKESILRSFDLTVIHRYFPEFEHEIRSRLAP
jgi:hypothetical protein